MTTAVPQREQGVGLIIGALLAIFLPPVGFVVALAMLIRVRNVPGLRAWWGLIYAVSVVTTGLLIPLLW